MKKIYVILTTSAILFSAATKAQDSFSGLIKSSPGDATKLLSAYGMPLFKGLGIDQNSGWNNTAKTKKLLGFELRITASAAFVPTSDKTFNVTQIGLSNHLRPDDPNQTIAPTFAGNKNTDGPLLDIYDDNGKKVGSFNTPAGVISVIPAPQIQLTVGLIHNTDVTIRAIPTVTVSDVGSISMIGFGVKHNILQDFAGSTADKLIPLDLSVALGFTRLNLTKTLSVEPDNGAQPKDGQQSTDFSNQRLEGHFNNFMIQAIVSKKLLFFTPFLSVGYNTSHASVGALGNYPVTTGGNFLIPTYTTFTNPVSISETVINNVRADIGFQLNLGFFRLYASYTQAQYKSVNGGIGFGI